MKHSLAQTVWALPYSNDNPPAIDRIDFLTAVFTINVENITGDPTTATLSVSLQHCDTEDGDFAEVADPMKFIGSKPGTVKAGYLYNVDLDLLACKRYIKVSGKITFEGGTNPAATTVSALALGDKTSQPV